MNTNVERSATRPRLLLTTALASTVIALATPVLLHAQVNRSVTAPAPVAVDPIAAAPVATTQTPMQPSPEGPQLATGFTEVAERVLPSVVSIRVEADAEQPMEMGGFAMPFEGDAPASPLVHGEGSGVIVREDGVILTNNHVVERARRLVVHLHDGRMMRARVLGVDPATDLALVKIDATGLPAARLGDSDHARVGEWVLAIGAPLGLEATVTHGVVSAIGRGGLGANEIEDYLQTDASINPGNSGGPLTNMRGEVLGINAMIVGRNTGIGMAIPSRIAQTVIEQILRNGHVTRGWLGVGVQDLSMELVTTMGIPAGAHGALVNAIEPGTPAARGALAVGDVVTAIDGAPVGSSMDLVRLVTRRGAGERLTLAVLRQGRAQTVAVTTVARPNSEPRDGRASEPQGEAAPRPVGLGARLSTMSPELAARLGAPADAIVIASVEPGGASDEAGLRRGDVILRADGRAVHNVNDVLSATTDHHATLLVRRGRSQVFVPVMTD